MLSLIETGSFSIGVSTGILFTTLIFLWVIPRIVAEAIDALGAR